MAIIIILDGYGLHKLSVGEKIKSSNVVVIKLDEWWIQCLSYARLIPPRDLWLNFMHTVEA